MKKELNHFADSGLIIFIAFFAAEYIIYELFYTYVNPDIWAEQIPHQYIFVINIFIGSALYIVISKKENLFEQIYTKATHLPDFGYYLFWILIVSVFSYGSYLVYNVLYSKLLGDEIVASFTDVNLYVKSATNPYHLFNSLLLNPLIDTLLYQRFLLSWLTKKLNFSKASIITALMYGYFSQDLLGATLYCLVLNLLCIKSNSIIYPVLINSLTSLAYVLMYSFSQYENKGRFILQSDLYAGDAETELRKGMVIMLLMSPVIVYVIIKLIREMRIINRGFQTVA